MNRIILISGNPGSGKTRKISSYKNLITTFKLKLVDLLSTRLISALGFLFSFLFYLREVAFFLVALTCYEIKYNSF